MMMMMMMMMMIVRHRLTIMLSVSQTDHVVALCGQFIYLLCYRANNLPGWIWPLISKSHAVFELVPVATKQLALFIAKPYHG